jgi:hypothetical protein
MGWMNWMDGMDGWMDAWFRRILPDTLFGIVYCIPERIKVE